MKIKLKIKEVFETVWLWLEYKRLLNFYKVTPRLKIVVPLSILLFSTIILIQCYLFVPEWIGIGLLTSDSLLVIVFVMIINILGVTFIPPLADFYDANKTFILSATTLDKVIFRSIAFNFKPVIALPFYFLPKTTIGIYIIALFGFPFIALNWISVTLILWFLITPILKGLLIAANYIVYKIATYPKGPMLFCSAFLGAIGATLKMYLAFI